MNKWITGQIFLQETFLTNCRFLVPENKRLIMIGCPDIDFLKSLKPSFGIGVTMTDDADFQTEEENPNIIIHHTVDIDTFSVEESFDFIIINLELTPVSDIHRFLRDMPEMIKPWTRIIINSYNPAWGFLIDRMNTLRKVDTEEHNRSNRFFPCDLENLLTISNYETLKKENYVLFPWPAPFLSAFINRFMAKMPLLKRCCLAYFMVARPKQLPAGSQESSTSVVITCRDEEGNIEALVERIPAMGESTEIVFVEGHSVDNTVGKIKEMIQKYPEKDIKLYHQAGIGQGDAFRLGFEKAEGDFLIWLEADLTTPPEEAWHLWETYADGHGEYVNGTRFVYPMSANAMPGINRFGNRFFSLIMSIVTGRRFTDTLCGFKGITKSGYRDIIENPNRFDALDPFGDFLLILGAVRYNLKISEVPVHYQPRAYGESKAYGSSRLGLLRHARVLFKICRQAFIDFRLL